MPNPVAHFEIYADDPNKLADFYKGLFGWKIERVPGMEYWRVHTVPTDAQGMPTAPGGINGGLMKRPTPEARNWLNYVSVASLDEMVSRARSMGAQLLRPKTAVPRIGWFAILADPDSNVFAIWQEDPNAG